MPPAAVAIPIITTAATLAAQDAMKPEPQKPGFNPISSGASSGSSPIQGSQNSMSPLVQGNAKPAKYAAISELLNNGGGSYA